MPDPLAGVFQKFKIFKLLMLKYRQHHQNNATDAVFNADHSAEFCLIFGQLEDF